MGDYAHTVQIGWSIYESCLEPRHLDAPFRQATQPFADQCESVAHALLRAAFTIM